MSKKSIYDLELHEDIRISYWNIIRVSGGWIYETWNENDTSISSCFVPYSDEFKGRSINTKIHAQAGAMYELLKEYHQFIAGEADHPKRLIERMIEIIKKIES